MEDEKREVAVEAEKHEVAVETVSKEAIDLLLEADLVDVFPRLDTVPEPISTRFREMIYCYLHSRRVCPQPAEAVKRVTVQVRDDQGRVICYFKNCKDAKKEAAVYLLDHPPSSHRSSSSALLGCGCATPTVFIKTKVTSGCLVSFVENDGTVGKFSPLEFNTTPREIQKVCIFHFRFGNADCHNNNTLSKIDGDKIHRLTPLDTEECFNNNFTVRRVWWAELNEAKEAFSDEMVKYVEELDVDRDIEYLKECGWDVPSQVTIPFKVFTFFLKKAVLLRLNPADLVSIAQEKHRSRASFDLASMVTQGNDRRLGDEAFLQKAYEKIEGGLTRYANRRL